MQMVYTGRKAAHLQASLWDNLIESRITISGSFTCKRSSKAIWLPKFKRRFSRELDVQVDVLSISRKISAKNISVVNFGKNNPRK